jgi:hypothetical protein
MTEWWICPWDNEVTIDDAPMHGIDCSAIPKNVYLIWWYPLLNCGEILYHPTKDRLGVREPFTDFAPYARFFDAWIRKAQIKTRLPAITLAQAKFVKSRMIDALKTDGRVHKNRVAEMTTIEQIAAYNILEN